MRHGRDYAVRQVPKDLGKRVVRGCIGNDLEPGGRKQGMGTKFLRGNLSENAQFEDDGIIVGYKIKMDLPATCFKGES